MDEQPVRIYRRIKEQSGCPSREKSPPQRGPLFLHGVRSLATPHNDLLPIVASTVRHPKNPATRCHCNSVKLSYIGFTHYSLVRP